MERQNALYRSDALAIVPCKMMLRAARGSLLALGLIATLVAGGWAVFAQRSGARQRAPAAAPSGSDVKLIREPGPSSRSGVPEWERDPQFRNDLFVFVRLRFSGSGRWGGRLNDYPGADLNFSYRLEQLTSMKVDPDGLVLDIDDPRLFDYPFAFISDPRSMVLSQEEATNLRRYLLNGGFLMLDDYWGDRMWQHLMDEMKKVFPDRDPVPLSLDHAIFNQPFVLNEKPQVPSEDSAHATQNAPGLYRTWEYEITWESPQPADYWAYLDDKGRVVMLICWNTDLGDGWEEEGVSEWYFTNFAEKSSYPMGINIVVYALTH